MSNTATELTGREALLCVLRKTTSGMTATETNETVQLADPARALRKLAVAGFVTPQVLKSGPVFRGRERAWKITSEGRSYINNVIKGR